MSTRKLPLAKIVNEEAFITVVWDGAPQTTTPKDFYFQAALEAYKAENWDTLYDLMNPATAMNLLYRDEELIIAGDNIFWQNRPVHGTICRRILSNLTNSIPCSNLLNFLRNLMKNPSEDSRNELYDFLENQHIPITDAGTFIAYKSVQSDFYSVHSNSTTKVLQGKVSDGKILNTVGSVIVVDRSSVDSDRSRECSSGLHVGTHEYAESFHKGHLLLVEVNPADVVSVPRDYNAAKVRTCAYKVIGICGAPIPEGKVVTSKAPELTTYGTKPDGSKFHNLRDAHGRFIRKS